MPGLCRAPCWVALRWRSRRGTTLPCARHPQDMHMCRKARDRMLMQLWVVGRQAAEQVAAEENWLRGGPAGRPLQERRHGLEAHPGTGTGQAVR